MVTRINVVPTSELTNLHLLAEYRELPRVFTYARSKGESVIPDVPQEYTLGKGHVKFFANRLTYCMDRYVGLCNELDKRGYRTFPVNMKDLLKGVSISRFNDYKPTQKALLVNRERIAKRLSGDKS